VEQVAHFKLDLGLIEGDSHHPDLLITPWVDDELVIFAAPDHPFSQQKSLKLRDLASENWILRERGSGTRQVFEAAMRHQLTHLKILLELEHTEAIKRAVESGLGIGCVSRLALKDAFKRGSLVPLEIEGLDLKRQFNFVLHKQKFISTGMANFLALCRQVTQGAPRSDLIVMRKPDGTAIEYR
jgi:DNA-binding transcriptional LysR family regulator